MEGFYFTRIILSKGSLADSARRRLVERICRLFPEAEIVEQLQVAHNRMTPEVPDPLARRDLGKKTLVFGDHRSAVRRSREVRNTCPNYWHFSPYGFCPYRCTYCYLAGATGVFLSPTVKIFLNLSEMLGKIDRIAMAAERPTAFYLGKLQDGLALDPLTGYSRTLMPFFARHPYARLVLLTKSAEVSNLLSLDHGGHTVLSWSLNPSEVSAKFEVGAPPPEERIQAMRACAAAGYPVRAVIMPIIPTSDWERFYAAFLERLFSRVDLERITLGGMCSYPRAVAIMERAIGRDNPISGELNQAASRSADGRMRYPAKRRLEIYWRLVGVIRGIQPELPVGLCLEDPDVAAALEPDIVTGRCNCVL